MALLEIKDLHIQVPGREILKGVNLTVKEGEVHALGGERWGATCRMSADGPTSCSCG